MRYPNITAEYEATRYHIDTLSKHAGVTKELMREVLYGDEELSAKELMELCYLFGRTSDYLLAPKVPTLTLEDPETRHRAKDLRKLLKQAKPHVNTDPYVGFTNGHRFEYSQKIYSDMASGKAVTVTAYNHSVRDLKGIINSSAERNRTVRSESMGELATKQQPIIKKAISFVKAVGIGGRI